MDVAIYRHLGFLPDLKPVRVPKDSYTAGYFAFLVPAITVAFCSWFLLRLFSRTQQVRKLLRSAGIVALIAPPAWWLCATYAASGRYGWNLFAAIQLYEMLLALVFGILYLSGNWPIPDWPAIVILGLHFGFWLWQFGPHPFFVYYGGPIAPAAGLCAGLTWVFYLRRLRRLRGTA